MELKWKLVIEIKACSIGTVCMAYLIKIGTGGVYSIVSKKIIRDTADNYFGFYSRATILLQVGTLSKIHRPPIHT